MYTYSKKKYIELSETRARYGDKYTDSHWIFELRRMKPEWAAGSRRRVPATRSTPHPTPDAHVTISNKNSLFFPYTFYIFRCALCSHAHRAARSSGRPSTRSLFDSRKRKTTQVVIINTNYCHIILPARTLNNFSRQYRCSYTYRHLNKNIIIIILHFMLPVFYTTIIL